MALKNNQYDLAFPIFLILLGSALIVLSIFGCYNPELARERACADSCSRARYQYFHAQDSAEAAATDARYTLGADSTARALGVMK